VAKRSKARVCGRSLAGIVGSNPSRGHGCTFVSVVCVGQTNALLVKTVVTCEAPEHDVTTSLTPSLSDRTMKLYCDISVLNESLSVTFVVTLNC